jgi:1,2-phenylacetyl-CoA epoxidase catalytic subunit
MPVHELRSLWQKIDMKSRSSPKTGCQMLPKTNIRQISQHAHSEIVGMLPEGN